MHDRQREFLECHLVFSQRPLRANGVLLSKNRTASTTRYAQSKTLTALHTATRHSPSIATQHKWWGPFFLAYWTCFKLLVFRSAPDAASHRGRSAAQHFWDGHRWVHRCTRGARSCLLEWSTNNPRARFLVGLKPGQKTTQNPEPRQRTSRVGCICFFLVCVLEPSILGKFWGPFWKLKLDPKWSWRHLDPHVIFTGFAS